ncbi:DgyrCDS3058 [Dimorphilus gyrociliatus]|uniref:DgyrCDS3058 n=1 Tax=Dimorphilus gyrociliatus TaxID=2664684 RepID=A0A7I8VCM7_9ANNE|nr:DgyrCDS3058 [Dimorphilus gyrociliatus]
MSNNTELVKLFDDFWQWRMKEFPEFSSLCGFKKYDNKLDDFSLQSFDKKAAEASEFLVKANTIKQSLDLNFDDEMNLLLFEEQLKCYINGHKYKMYLMPVNFMENVVADFQQLSTWTTFAVEEDFKNYIERLKAFPTKLEQVIGLLEEGIKTGIVSHHSSLMGVCDNIEKVINSKPTDNFFYQPLKACTSQTIIQSAIDCICNDIQPALEKFQSYLQNVYLKNTRKEEGIRSLPNGKEIYQACIDFHLTDTNVHTAEELHQIGLEEIEKIKMRMDAIMKKANFQGNFKEFLHFLRNNSQFYFESSEETLAEYKRITFDVIRPKLELLFKNIPKSNLTVDMTPSSKPDAAVAFYSAGTPDGSRPGTVYVNVRNPKMLGSYEMTTLALHEGEPGHHFQTMYSAEMTDEPQFKLNMEDMNYFMAPARFPICTGFMEGWGLYCESLGYEMGLYNNPYDEYGCLSFDAHRICRLVVDTGLHVLGWTEEKAVQYILDNTAITEKFAINEVRRYISLPGQALAYKFGQMKIRALRQLMKDKLQEKYDIKDFHELVLKCGCTSLSVLEKVVNNKIREISE